MFPPALWPWQEQWLIVEGFRNAVVSTKLAMILQQVNAMLLKDCVQLAFQLWREGVSAAKGERNVGRDYGEEWVALKRSKLPGAADAMQHSGEPVLRPAL